MRNLLAIGLLAGTIIGAGVFSLPYVFNAAGLTSGFFYLALATVAYICVYRMYAAVIEKTPGDHRFVGYAKIHLGKAMSGAAILMTIVQMFLVLTIYLILSQSFGNLITAFGSGVEKMVVFWFLGSVAIFLGLRRIAWIESLIVLAMVAIIILLFILGVGRGTYISGSNWPPVWGNLFLPLGPILFALAGRVAIPAMVRIGGAVNKAIFWGVSVPAAVYALFVISVLALSPSVSRDAVTGLIGQVPVWILPVIGALGILSLISSYMTVGFDVYRSLSLDLRFPGWLQFLLIVFGPLALFFAGLRDFIGLVSFVGGIFIALESIFIIWMWLKATSRKVNWPVALLLLVFLVALVYEMLK